MQRLFFLSILAVALAACSSDPTSEVNPPATRPITVEATERPLADSDPAARETRADVVTAASISSFKMYGAETTYEATRSGSRWTANPGYWPPVEDAQTVDFYGYSTGTLNNADSDPYISVTMDENLAQLSDVLVAKTSASYKAQGGMVTLTFDHATAAVDFTVRKTVDKTIVLKSLRLTDVCKQGEYHFVVDRWTNVAASTYYTLTTADMTLSTEPQALAAGTLFFIPQTLGTLQITVAVDGIERSGSLRLDKPIEAGKRYPIHIELGRGL